MTQRRHIEGRSSVYKTALLLTVFLMIVSGLIAPSVVAQESPEAISFISSRFMLWDEAEKLIDNNFQIHIYNLNQSENASFYYEIIVNDNITSGIGYNYVNYSYDLESQSMIFILEVKVNNETILQAENILIFEGLSASGIRHDRSIFTINLEPWKWSAMQWNIVLSIICSSMLAMIIGYRVAKRYRRLHGVKEVS